MYRRYNWSFEDTRKYSMIYVIQLDISPKYLHLVISVIQWVKWDISNLLLYFLWEAKVDTLSLSHPSTQ